MDYGRAIKVVRTAKKLSQQQLADLIKVDASYVSKIESGQEPSVKTLEKISETLHTPMVLIMLLASDKKNLMGIDENQAMFLGKELMSVLVSVK
jgi:transcriptional regulator with XRE-family HTH domain